MLKRLGRGLLWPFVRVADARGFRKVGLVAAECLLAVVCGAALFRATCLLGLPDVGPPFTAADLRPPSVAADRDAFVLFEQATLSYTGGKRQTELTGDEFQALMPPWGPDDGPDVLAWLDARREALDLFVRGAERPEATSRLDPSATFSSNRQFIRLNELTQLSLVESARLLRAGDLDGAWRYLVAPLRAAGHLAARGDYGDRLWASALRNQVQRRLPAWADDPRNTPDRLRRALAEVRTLGQAAPDDAYTLATLYLAAAKDYAGPDSRVHAVKSHPIRINGEYEVPLEWTRKALNFRRWLEREPERGRRVIDLLAAHWKAALKTPPGGRPPLALTVMYQYGSMPVRLDLFDLFDLPSDAPAGARALSPESLAAWLASSTDARRAFGPAWNSLKFVRDKERADQQALILALAVAAYRLQHPDASNSDTDVTGAVMKTLPEDFFQDESDGSTPVIDLGAID